MFDISGGQKTLFFKKCPNNGLVSEKKYIEKFFIVGGGGGGPKYEKFHTFFFFLMKASLMRIVHVFMICLGVEIKSEMITVIQLKHDDVFEVIQLNLCSTQADSRST